MTAPTVNTHPYSALMSAARDLLERASLVDISEQKSAEVIEAIEAVHDLLGEPSRERLLRRPFDAVQRERERGAEGRWFPTGFNPVYPQPVMRFEDDRVIANWRSSAFEEGPPNSVHGGISAFLIDVVAGVMIQALGIRAVTAQLDMKYRQRLPLDADIEIVARLSEVDGRKHWVDAEIIHDGVKAVTARGLFITIDV
ncbi:PaaI family thioesterase [Microbacterium sp. YY-03]|uniref:PaaI family thioesterase n=1 Tax=Microbacterium sp. YY-03 TaxID=3421636 RepID=UPI003D18386F